MSPFESFQAALSDLPHFDPAWVEASAAECMAAATTPWLTGVDQVIGVLDLTSLKSTDNPDTIRALVDKAARPDPLDESCPRPAAVCVYSDLVGIAVSRRASLDLSDLKVVSVVGGFPHGRVPAPVALLEASMALDSGADEVDMVLDRGAFLSGQYAKAFDSVYALAELAQRYDAKLKVILETGELGSFDSMHLAGRLAVAAGADFIKTSTGKSAPAATPESTWVLLATALEVYDSTGQVVGVKPAGGVKTAEQALGLVVMVDNLFGPGWFNSSRVRLGASAVLDDLVRARRALLGLPVLPAAPSSEY